MWYQSLAVAYSDKFNALGDLDALDHALKFHLLALELTPESDPNILVAKSNLSVIYMSRFGRLGNKADLDASLDYDLAVIKTASPDDPALPQYQQNLSLTYMAYFERFGEPEALRLSMEWITSAVKNTKPSDPALPSRQRHLASAYTNMFQRFGNKDDLISALHHAQLSLKITPPADLIECQSVLALAYRASFHATSNLSHLEKAIQLQRSIIDLIPASDPRLPSCFSNLADSYTARFRRLEDFGDLEFAMEYRTAAVESCPPNHPSLADYQHGLAHSYLDSYIMLQDPIYAENALECMRESLSNTPPDHRRKLSLEETLGTCYYQVYVAKNRLADLEKAIEIKQSVLDRTPSDDPDLAAAYFLLAKSYAKHFSVTNDPKSLSCSLLNHTKALELTHPTYPDHANFAYNLGIAYSLSYDETRNESDLIHSLSHFKLAATSSGSSSYSYWAATYWGTLALKHSLVPSALEAFTIAFDILPELIWIGSSMTVRHEYLSNYKISVAASAAAVAAVKAGEPERAAEFLEQGLGVTYRQMLQLRDEASEELMQKHPELAKRLREISAELYRIEESPFSTAENIDGVKPDLKSYHLLAIERADLIARIRALEGFKNFLLPPRFTDLAIAANKGPVIMVYTSEWGAHAIIVLSQPHRHARAVALPGVTPKSTEGVLAKLKEALRAKRIRSRCSEDVDLDENADEGEERGIKNVREDKPVMAQLLFKEVLDWLQTFVVEPIFQALKEVSKS
jgi:tetratricopeptide (TPR) repeat protein